MNPESPLVRCDLPIRDIQVIGAARGAKIREVLVADGTVERALNSIPGEYSVSSMAFVLKERVIVSAESVDFGPKAEIFRLRVFTETDSAHALFSPRMHPVSECPSDLDLAGVCEGTFQPVVLRSRNHMTVEIVPSRESRIDVIVDYALLLMGSTGAKLLVEHDHMLPLSLRISTSSKVIERAIARYAELVVI